MNPTHPDSALARRERALQRVWAGAWLLACVGLALMAWRYQPAFSYEPVGPRAYPLLCLGLMALGLAWLLARPPALEVDPHAPPMGLRLLRKIVLCMAVLLGYAALFERLGFIAASTLAGSVLARLTGGRAWPSLGAGVAMGIGLYLLFDRLLDVPLPRGVLAFLS
ncbi:MAG TPA: tripartite tricarboxylate transporter TctB family protein [Stenotrophomonas sp.]|nr:tripartite tricarboxylate transporter TctB family protein [Stenotrophomonas sp.]